MVTVSLRKNSLTHSLPTLAASRELPRPLDLLSLPPVCRVPPSLLSQPAEPGAVGPVC